MNPRPSFRRSLPRAAAVLIALKLCLVAAAGAAPPPLQGLTGIGAPPADDQRQRIGTYTGYYVDQLESEDPAKINEARQRLLAPLGALDVSAFFRKAYSDALLPELGPVIRGRNGFGAVASMQVVAELGTEEALDMLQEHFSAAAQPSVAVRMWAARGLRTVLPRPGQELGLIRDVRVNPALRELGRAAASEPDWRVLQWQLDALASVPSPVSREEQVKVMRAILQRMAAAKEASPMIRTLGLSSDAQAIPTGPLISLTHAFHLDNDPAAQRRVGPELIELLVQVLEVAEKHWESAQANPELKVAYQRAVRLSEIQLGLISRTLNRAIASTELEKHFEAGDREQYRAALETVRAR